MMDTATFQVTASGERELVMTREFDAPRSLVLTHGPSPSCSSAGWVCATAGRWTSVRST